MKTKSPTPEISLAFLDIMSCGFGAFILLFLIIKHNYDTVAELPEDYLDQEILILKTQNEMITSEFNAISKEEITLNERIVLTKENISTSEKILQSRVKIIKSWDKNKASAVDKLKFEIKEATEKQQSLKDSLKTSPKDNLKFIGEGNREYLSGIKSGGRNILILLDASASMLDQKIVNILRRRNMEGRKRNNSKKWQQAISTVEWISARFPYTSKYQIVIFNEKCMSLSTNSNLSWLSTSNTDQLEKIISKTRKIKPEGGTNLYKAFLTANELQPPPDNIYLITDGLPTLGKNQNTEVNVTGKRRLEFFNEATDILSKEIPINVILLPMEGDPLAAWAYWGIASVTNGSFLSPADDWP